MKSFRASKGHLYHAHDGASWKGSDVIPNLIQVGVAPYLSIGENSGNDSSLTVILPPLSCWTSLQARHLSSTAKNKNYACVNIYEITFASIPVLENYTFLYDWETII